MQFTTAGDQAAVYSRAFGEQRGTNGPAWTNGAVDAQQEANSNSSALASGCAPACFRSAPAEDRQGQDGKILAELKKSGADHRQVGRQRHRGGPRRTRSWARLFEDRRLITSAAPGVDSWIGGGTATSSSLSRSRTACQCNPSPRRMRRPPDAVILNY